MMRDSIVLKTINLTTDERDTIYNRLEEINSSPYGAGFDEFYSDICGREDAFPQRVKEALRDFGHAHGRSGVLLVRGLPVSRMLQPTPTIPYEHVPDKVIGTEKYLLISASMIGRPIGFADWHQGERIQNLYPISELKCIQCASNAVYLEMHTETAFRLNTPTHLLLLCLKKDPRGEAKTVFCDLAAMVDSMSEAARRILAAPNFCFEILSDGSMTLTAPKPIDTEQDDKRRLHYAEALTAIDASSRAVLAELRDRISANSVVLEMQEGDLVLIDNYHVVHGRTAYLPRYDGTDRWLQRVLIGKADL